MDANEVDADEIKFRTRRMGEQVSPFFKPFYQATDNKKQAAAVGCPDGRVISADGFRRFGFSPPYDALYHPIEWR